MSASAAGPMEAPQWKRFVSLENRYIAPIFITLILLVGHLSFGILESYQKTLLAIAAGIGTELILSRLFFGKWPNLASAYITGISVGILIRSPAFWPYAVCSIVSITSKYVLRVKGPTHLESIEFWHFGDAVPGARDGGQSEHSMGKLPVTDGGDLGAGFGDYLPAEAIPYQRALCGFVSGVCFFAELADGESVAGGNCADYRADVSTFYIFHDY